MRRPLSEEVKPRLMVVVEIGEMERSIIILFQYISMPVFQILLISAVSLSKHLQAVPGVRLLSVLNP